MAVEERDTHTGYLTTGHEWNGIKELNTPVPRAVYFFLIVTALYSFIYWVLMPAWPLGVSYTKGLLGLDDRVEIADTLKSAAAERNVWSAAISTGSLADLQHDPAIMDVSRKVGRVLFGDNCAGCHGRDGTGQTGYPKLTDTASLWDTSPDATFETIKVGVNSTNPQSRSSQMLAFGRDGMLKRDEIGKVVTYVRSLSQPDVSKDAAEAVEAGRAIFAENCVSCHGEDGKGKKDVGGPDLTDSYWLYGGDEQSIFRSVWNGRQGHMPTWEARLSDLDRKILTLYVLDLRGKAQ